MSLSDLQCEQQYLACCLLDPTTLEAGAVSPDMMTSGETRSVLAAMLQRRGRGEDIDTPGLCTELGRMGWGKDRAIGVLLPLTDHVPPSRESVSARIRTLHEARLLAAAGREGASHAERLELDEARERFALSALGGGEEAPVYTARGLMEAAAEAWVGISEEREREARGERTLYLSLRMGRRDPVVKLGPGDLLTMGAATGTAKSTMASTLMMELEDRRIPSGYVWIEDAPHLVGSRFIGARGEVDTAGFWRGAASPDAWNSAMRAAAKAAASDDRVFAIRPTAGIDDIVRAMARLVRVYGVRILMVDYLQAIQATTLRNATRRDQTDYVLARLTAAARTLGVPLVLFSQLSRSEKGGNRFPEPHLGDLKESGTLENASDAVVLMWIMTDDKNDQRYGIVRAKVAKTRMDGRGDRWAMRRGYGQVLEEIEGWSEPQEPQRRGY